MTNDTKVTFSELYTTDFSLRDLFAMSQRWCPQVWFARDTPRRTSGIIYLSHCTGQYIDRQGNSFFAPCSSLVCLPQGSVYKVLNLECAQSPTDAFLVEFNVDRAGSVCTFGDAPFLMQNVNTALAAEYVIQAVHAFEAPIRSPAAVKAAIYRLVAFLCRETQHTYRQKYQTIAAGIEYMEENALSDIPIEELAQRCRVSSGCFRKLFKEYSGKSPLQYRLDLKINMAKKMLENGDMTLEDIAYALNLESGAYFCKLFKKRTGQTPGEYRKSRT